MLGKALRAQFARVKLKLTLGVVPLDRQPHQRPPARRDVAQIAVLADSLRHAPVAALSQAPPVQTLRPLESLALVFAQLLQPRQLPSHPQIVQTRRLLEMRLDEIGHNLEDRSGHVEAALSPDRLETRIGVETRGFEADMPLEIAERKACGRAKAGFREKSILSEGGATERGVALEGGATERGVAREGGAIERGVAREGGAIETGVAREGGATERGVAREGGAIETGVAREGGATETGVAREGGANEIGLALEVALSNRPCREAALSKEASPVKVALSKEALPVKVALSKEASPVKVALTKRASPVKVALSKRRCP